MTTAPYVALVEVFRSVQGEGFHAGRPAIFVRLAGCPLACEFAPGVVCDTPYQVAKSWATVDELFGEIIPSLGGLETDSVRRKRQDVRAVPMLILTGGEPTVNPQFDALADRANKCGFYTAVETNGTVWREGLRRLDWISVSPKDAVPQTSKAQWHNAHPRGLKLLARVRLEVATRKAGAEYRYVIGGRSVPAPPYYAASRHYVSPAVRSDGSGEEWKTGFPGFAVGALERCLEIVQADPRWRISTQQHKLWCVR